MFWHKRTTHKFPLIVFGLVALGIIISSTILIVELYQERENLELKQLNSDNVSQTNSLETKYFLAINRLLDTVNKASSIDEAINSTKDIFLSVHVPAEMRNAHLAAFLQVLKLEDKKTTFTLNEVKDSISSLLRVLLESK